MMRPPKNAIIVLDEMEQLLKAGHCATLDACDSEGWEVDPCNPTACRFSIIGALERSLWMHRCTFSQTARNRLAIYEQIVTALYAQVCAAESVYAPPHRPSEWAKIEGFISRHEETIDDREAIALVVNVQIPMESHRAVAN